MSNDDEFKKQIQNQVNKIIPKPFSIADSMNKMHESRYLKYYIDNEDEFIFRQISQPLKSENGIPPKAIKYQSNDLHDFINDSLNDGVIVLEIREDEINVNNQIWKIGDIKSVRYRVGIENENTEERYLLEFKDRNDKTVTFIYKENIISPMLSPLQFDPYYVWKPKSSFYSVWVKILKMVSKYIIPPIFDKTLQELKQGNVIKFGNKHRQIKYVDLCELKVVIEGVFLKRKIGFFEKEILIPWEKVIFENQRSSTKVSSSVYKTDYKLLEKLNWNIDVLFLLRNYFIEHKHRALY